MPAPPTAAPPAAGEGACLLVRRAWTRALLAGTGRAGLLTTAGKGRAVAALREAGREIGRVLATCVSLLNPSIICVGGILAHASEQLLAGVREVVYGRPLPLATGDLQIVASRTAGLVGVIGAATMVIQQVISVDEVESQVAALAG